MDTDASLTSQSIFVSGQYDDLANQPGEHPGQAHDVSMTPTGRSLSDAFAARKRRGSNTIQMAVSAVEHAHPQRHDGGNAGIAMRRLGEAAASDAAGMAELDEFAALESRLERMATQARRASGQNDNWAAAGGGGSHDRRLSHGAGSAMGVHEQAIDADRGHATGATALDSSVERDLGLALPRKSGIPRPQSAATEVKAGTSSSPLLRRAATGRTDGTGGSRIPQIHHATSRTHEADGQSMRPPIFDQPVPKSTPASVSSAMAGLDPSTLTEAERTLAELVQQKVTALNEQIERYREEIERAKAANAEVEAARRRVEEHAHTLAKERSQFTSWRETETARLEAQAKDMTAKVERERRVAMRQAKAHEKVASAIPERQDKAELDALRGQVAKLKADLSAGEARYTSSISRHKVTVAKLEETIAELQEKIGAYEAERVGLVFGGAASSPGARPKASPATAAGAGAGTGTAAAGNAGNSKNGGISGTAEQPMSRGRSGSVERPTSVAGAGPRARAGSTSTTATATMGKADQSQVAQRPSTASASASAASVTHRRTSSGASTVTRPGSVGGARAAEAATANLTDRDQMHVSMADNDASDGTGPSAYLRTLMGQGAVGQAARAPAGGSQHPTAEQPADGRRASDASAQSSIRDGHGVAGGTDGHSERDGVSVTGTDRLSEAGLLDITQHSTDDYSSTRVHAGAGLGIGIAMSGPALRPLGSSTIGISAALPTPSAVEAPAAPARMHHERRASEKPTAEHLGVTAGPGVAMASSLALSSVSDVSASHMDGGLVAQQATGMDGVTAQVPSQAATAQPAAQDSQATLQSLASAARLSLLQPVSMARPPALGGVTGIGPARVGAGVAGGPSLGGLSSSSDDTASGTRSGLLSLSTTNASISGVAAGQANSSGAWADLGSAGPAAARVARDQPSTKTAAGDAETDPLGRLSVQLRAHLAHMCTPEDLSRGIVQDMASGRAPGVQLLAERALEGGKIELRYSDGTRLVRFKNGTEKEARPDGAVIVRFSNGDVKRSGPLPAPTTPGLHAHAASVSLRPAGDVPVAPTEVYYYSQAGTLHSSYPAMPGTSDNVNNRPYEVFDFASGQTELHWGSTPAGAGGDAAGPTASRGNGDKEILFSDGTVKTVQYGSAGPSSSASSGPGTAVTYFADGTSSTELVPPMALDAQAGQAAGQAPVPQQAGGRR